MFIECSENVLKVTYRSFFLRKDSAHLGLGRTNVGIAAVLQKKPCVTGEHIGALQSVRESVSE